MNKTVTYNGEKIKVEFVSNHISRDFDSFDRKENTHEYVINGNLFKVNSTSTRGRSGKFSSSIMFEGQLFPDSEKKVIEHILSKYKLI